ncbi:putative C11R protein [Orthopoxvirus Abatino]|uniref:Putative C11R protein n=1 Tax=Orthopoxvirus Abatino TaxID=2478919 RepID=A0A3G2KXM5_9POXV|nr:putative C11R protein [Orthopoxvirus Abatino]AYN64580.1 putative C11R protein [Orthopoxvirus Abatino]
MSFKYLMLFAAMIIGSFADNVTVETTSPEIANATTDIPAIILCGPEGDGYCLHGDCIHARDIDGMYCRCYHGYTGIRCQHIVLVDYQRSENPDTTTSYPSPSIVLVLVGIIITCCLLSVYRFTRRTKLPLQDMVVP